MTNVIKINNNYLILKIEKIRKKKLRLMKKEIKKVNYY